MRDLREATIEQMGDHWLAKVWDDSISAFYILAVCESMEEAFSTAAELGYNVSSTTEYPGRDDV